MNFPKVNIGLGWKPHHTLVLFNSHLPFSRPAFAKLAQQKKHLGHQ